MKNYYPHIYIGLPWWLRGKESACLGETLFQSLGGENSLEEVWQPTPGFLPRKSYGQRSLAGYSPWDRKED